MNSLKLIRHFCKSVEMSAKFVWVDLEMTGLDVDKHTIMEAACIITTPELEVLHNGFQAVIHLDDEELQKMNEWERNKSESKSALATHLKETIIMGRDHKVTNKDFLLVQFLHFRRTGLLILSGLTAACRKSSLSLADVEKMFHDYVVGLTSRSDTLYMAGNTIYVDRTFVMKYMPMVDKLLHYRLIDVSTVKTLSQQWYPGQKIAPNKKLGHRALDDILESIEELRAYKRHIFK